ncbi:ATP synthase F0 subunit A [Candidatus Parcubacteria bacterium]|nr:MAG: ATP synthase F0 subunit A [Candidatus Parcubacteria bacterium]
MNEEHNTIDSHEKEAVHTETNEHVLAIDEHTNEYTTEAHTEEESSHTHPIYAEQFFGPVTNSLFTSWIAVIIIISIAFAVKRKTRLVPKGVQNFMEMVVEYFLDFFDSITGSRKKSEMFFPFIFTFFVYVLVSNWMGLLPGVGTVGKYVVEEGHEVFVPLLRGGTADLNTTLALAIIAVVASHIIGVISIGVWHHFNKFINIKAIMEIPKKFKEDKLVLMVNPVVVLASLLEIVTEIAKVASLSFRLFGNVFAGEVLLATMSAMLAFGLPLPFMFLEVLVGAVQALVFALLTLSYLTMATEKH